MSGTRQSLDEVVALSVGLQDREELWVLLRDHLKGHGLRACAYVSARASQNGEGPRTDGLGQWGERYLEGHLGADPAMVRAGRSATPCLWSDLSAVEMPPAPGQDAPRSAAAYLADLREAGGEDGLVLPLWGPSARSSYVLAGFGGAAAPLDRTGVAALHAAALAINARLVRRDPGPTAPRVSPREREVLLWMARGRSNAAIAGLLSVSYHTVDTMVRRIFAKLEATDRTSATVRGLATGVIELQDVS